MKYYSEITKKNYDTVEALEEAEAKTKTQAENKLVEKEAAVTERKAAAKIVEDAFTHASQIRKDNSAKRDILDEELKSIDKKYDTKFLELKKEYDAKDLELSKQREEEYETMDKKFKELDKADKEALDKAYDELRAFCKKYGTYHYSVDTAGAELFPLLMGFGQVEKAQNIFQNMFNSMFNLW